LKKFFSKHASKFIKVAILLGILIAISVSAMLLLRAFGIIYYNEEGLQLSIEIFDDFKSSWYGAIIIIILQVVLTNLLCFIPGASMAFIMLVSAMYENPWGAFLISFVAVMLSSLIMYLIGRFGGYAICKKILGEEDCKKASELLNNKGAIYFPLMMMFPVFPDDALVMIAGTLKMDLKWFIPSIVFGRGIGIATIIFGLGSIPFDKFTSVWHWVLFILGCAVLICGVLYAAHRFNKFLEKKRQEHAAESTSTNGQN
jgi:uncharacterized membrane protein YdjX (TVP38/TMEM64 family)